MCVCVHVCTNRIKPRGMKANIIKPTDSRGARACTLLYYNNILLYRVIVRRSVGPLSHQLRQRRGIGRSRYIRICMLIYW